MTAAVDLYAGSLRQDSGPLVLHDELGGRRALPVEIWTATHVPGDESLVTRCKGATLDVGCGPGRLVLAIGARGLPCLGVDIAPGAVRLARSRGALVLGRSIFARLPGRGRWQTALLADGNIGIGGDPIGLLERLGELLSPNGQVLVELEEPGVRTRPTKVRIEHDGQVSDWFDWAHVSVDHAEQVASGAGFTLHETWKEAGRWFVALARP